MKKWTFRERWNFVVLIVLHVLLHMTAYVFQSMIFPYIRLAGLIPMLLPIVCTGVAVYQGRVAGGVSGLFAGILCDVSFNNPVGFYTVVLTLAGIAVGTLTDTVLTRKFGSFFLCSIAVLAIMAFLQLFPLMFFEGVAPNLLFSTALRQIAYSLLFTIPIWFFARSLGLRAGVIV